MVGQQSIGAAVTTVPVRPPTNSIRIRGSDTVTLIKDVATIGTEAGDVLIDLRLVPSISNRLAIHSTCYNEIFYHSLKARINGQASSLTVGSIIMAFCSDPADEVPSGVEAIAWARSQQCNVSGKYWETIELTIPHSQLIGPNGGSFKNNAGTSTAPRTYSPGFLAVIVVSPANQATPLELQLEWDVTLRNPTLNTLVEEGARVVAALSDFGLQGSATADQTFDPNLKVFPEGDLSATDFSPSLEAGKYYVIPGGQVTVTANTGASGAPASVVATHIGLVGDKVGLYRYLISSQEFKAITATELPYKPLLLSAPTWREGSEWKTDPDSPAFGTPTQGFRLLSLQSSPSRRRA